jgi:hypothetical protein
VYDVAGIKIYDDGITTVDGRKVGKGVIVEINELGTETIAKVGTDEGILDLLKITTLWLEMTM